MIAMGYVSDYTLGDYMLLAATNEEELKKQNIPFHFEIGTEDRFVRTQNRRCSFELHNYLEKIDLDHGFEILHGVEHGFDSFWHYTTDEGIPNGLWHLKFHENARKKNFDQELE